MTLEDFVFLAQFFNFGTALLAAVIISWTRHGYPDDEQTFDDPSPVVQFVYGLDTDYMSLRDRDDKLTEMDKQRMAQMVRDGANLSRRGAVAYGISRDEFERMAYGLADVGVAEYGGGRALTLNTEAWQYLRLPRPGSVAS